MLNFSLIFQRNEKSRNSEKRRKYFSEAATPPNEYKLVNFGAGSEQMLRKYIKRRYWKKKSITQRGNLFLSSEHFIVFAYHPRLHAEREMKSEEKDESSRWIASWCWSGSKWFLNLSSLLFIVRRAHKERTIWYARLVRPRQTWTHKKHAQHRRHRDTHSRKSETFEEVYVVVISLLITTSSSTREPIVREDSSRRAHARLESVSSNVRSLGAIIDPCVVHYSNDNIPHLVKFHVFRFW